MPDRPAANRKLDEAEFFFALMGKHFDRHKFVYFLSAFLSALFSCTEHNRLFSKNSQFRVWFEEVKRKYLQSPDLLTLRKLRVKEVHFAGTEMHQNAGMSFPDGIETTSLVLEMDFRAGKPRGRYKSAEMEGFQEHPVEQRWVWDTESQPDVIETCKKGLDIVREIIKSRDAEGFPD